MPQLVPFAVVSVDRPLPSVIGTVLQERPDGTPTTWTRPLRSLVLTRRTADVCHAAATAAGCCRVFPADRRSNMLHAFTQTPANIGIVLAFTVWLICHRRCLPFDHRRAECGCNVTSAVLQVL